MCDVVWYGVGVGGLVKLCIFHNKKMHVDLIILEKSRSASSLTTSSSESSLARPRPDKENIEPPAAASSEPQLSEGPLSTSSVSSASVDSRLQVSRSRGLRRGVLSTSDLGNISSSSGKEPLTAEAAEKLVPTWIQYSKENFLLRNNQRLTFIWTLFYVTSFNFIGFCQSGA